MSTWAPPARTRSTRENLLLCIERIPVTRTKLHSGILVVTSAADMEQMKRAPSASASKRSELPNAASKTRTG